MKSGTRKRELGNLRKNLTALITERRALDHARGQVRHRKNATRTDVIEVCAGCAVITRQASSFGLRAGQPIDILYGWDLLDAKGEKEFQDYIDRSRPRLLVCEPPCTDWCFFNDVINFQDRPKELEKRRNIQRRLMRTIAKACAKQLARGDHFVWENPRGSRMWSEPIMLQLLALGKGKVIIVDCDMCAYDKKSRKGWYLLKPTRWMVSHEFLAEALSRRCTKDHYHQQMEGALETMLSGVYSQELANCVCDAVVRIKSQTSGHIYYIEDLNYDRRYPWCDEMSAHEAYYLDAVQDEVMWRPMLDRAAQILEQQSNPNYHLEMQSSLWKDIQVLVPWRLQTIQVSKLPKAKRLAWHQPATHRCSVLWLMDDRIMIESERIADIAQPRQRFRSPVKIAIFIQGYAPDDMAEGANQAGLPVGGAPETAAQRRARVERERGPPPQRMDYNQEIWFEGCSPEEVPA